MEANHKPASLLKINYKLRRGPSPPTVEDYLSSSKTEWAELLQSDPTEEKVQSFLERNPMFLPGAWTPSVKSGHYPLHCAAISQPVLPSLRSKRPDFMWIAKHSSAWYPTLIEIEKPSKRIFTSKGVPSASFTQARNQLAEWRTWFSKPENVQQFISAYGIPDHIRLGRQMQLHMILIYGQRYEFEHSAELSEHRASLLAGADEELISFDRLAPDPELEEAITIRVTHPGVYRAVTVPPLFFLRPALADRLLAINGIDEALHKTPMISDSRRDFLISRIPYWQQWAKNSRSLVRNGDRE